MFVTNDIKYIGVNDHEIDLFEGQYIVPNGMSYNSYAIIDEKIAIMDSVDANFTDEWLKNIENVLEGRNPDYLVVHHMEPDHSANIVNFLEKYPNALVVASAKAFVMMKNFFGTDFSDRRIVVGEKDTLSLGKHTLVFVTAPMVHWPEVVVSYDTYDKVLFSADGDALYLSRLAKKVILVHRRDTLRATKIYNESLNNADNIEILWNSRVIDTIKEEKLTKAKLLNILTNEETLIDVDGIFVSIGRKPNTEFLNGILELENGYIVADETTQTSIPGVYAVGDVRTKILRQVVTAVSDGAVAAHFAEEYLNKCD